MTIAVLAAMRGPPPLASGSDSLVTGLRSGPGSVTSDSVTVSVVNGMPTYTILWAYLSGDTGISATSGSSFTTAFLGTISAGETRSCTIRGTVTDARSETSIVDVDVVLSDITT